MVVRPAREDELPAVWSLYAAVVEAMRGTPADILWEMGVHPTRERLLDAVRAGDLLVAVEDEVGCECAVPAIAGVCIVDGNQTGDYAKIPWRVDAASGKVQVIHLLAVDPAVRGRGVGRTLVEAAIDVARSRGALAVRLDVFDNNPLARALYQSCGFADLGVCTLNVGDGFVHAVNLMELDLRAAEGGAR